MVVVAGSSSWYWFGLRILAVQWLAVACSGLEVASLEALPSMLRPEQPSEQPHPICFSARKDQHLKLLRRLRALQREFEGLCKDFSKLFEVRSAADAAKL